ncbi:MAG: hypothetical protein ACI8X5_003544 [Planctomycetota bacterium]|jgi:hypothetical protein
MRMILRNLNIKLYSWLCDPGFAWTFVVIVPVILIFVDPCIFQGEALVVKGPYLARYRLACYVATAIGMGTMVLRLTSNRRPALLAGALMASAVFAGALGLAMLPISLLGILWLGIGFLGFAPFLTSAVLACHADLAFRAAKTKSRWALAIAGFLLFFLPSTSIQIVFPWAATKSIDQICSPDPELQAEGQERFRRWSLLLDPDSLVFRWRRAEEEGVQKRLARAYFELTDGEEIEQRADLLFG